MSKEIKRYSIPANLGTSLASETYLIHRFIASGESAIDFNGIDPVDELRWRFNYLQSIGLYYPNPDKRGEVVWADVRIAQAEIALIHGLVYLGNLGRNSRFERIETLNSKTLPFDCRSQNHFTQIFNGGDARSLKRLDVALLAHVFQTPISVLEAQDRKVFQTYAQDLIHQRSLFHEGSEFLEVMRSTSPSLLVVHEHEIEYLLPKKATKRKRGFLIEEAPNDPSQLSVGDPIVVHARLSPVLGSGLNALLFGRVGETWQLLSVPALMGDRLDVDADVFIPPKRVNELSGAKLKITAPGEFEVVLITSVEPLDSFPAWLRFRNALEREKIEAIKLTIDDFRWIREWILRRKKSRFHVLQRVLDVYDA
ncbi:MAG: hypothetical protein ABJP89_19125 [Lentilitoribacter sp.]